MEALCGGSCLSCLLLLCLLASPASSGALTSDAYKAVETHQARVLVTWDGGDACPICPDATNMQTFACSNQRGNWNDGKKTFTDPAPDHPEKLITSFSLRMAGRFYCQGGRNSSEVHVTLQGQTLFSGAMPHLPSGCYCGNCAAWANYSLSAPLGGWWSYNHSGTNLMQVLVTQNAICLHAVELVFNYTLKQHEAGTDGTLQHYGVWFIIIGFGVLVLTLVGVVASIKLKLKKARNGYIEVNGQHPPNYNALANTSGLDALLHGFSDAFEEVDIKELKMGPRIGKGSYAEVYKATWRGTAVAVKKLPAHLLTASFFDDFEREAALMKRLRHPNVLQFLGACLISPDVCIIMEMMPRGSLYRILHQRNIKLDWPLLRAMAMDAARGMNYLHTCEPIVLHRDMKSQNLLVDENWKVKVCDFGLSKIVAETFSATLTSCGTPCWTAPEVLRNERYTEKADVYSFGIVLWEMATREDPYGGMPPFQVVFAVATEKIRPEIPDQCPPAWADLIRRCWAEDPKQRPSFQQVLECLEGMPKPEVDYEDMHRQMAEEKEKEEAEAEAKRSRALEEGRRQGESEVEYSERKAEGGEEENV
ncbi:putative serine/threonine-protein kinase SIS8 [Balamuthia mandrillaris]